MFRPLIVPDSVVFRPHETGFQLLEQEFLPVETVSGLRVEDYIGQEATVTVIYNNTPPMTYHGMLLSTEGGLVLQRSGALM